ncbi:MAG: DEAD/DEAH box helicase [Fibrobacter sp.]|nr:DEAD/DEAH box helicase [Fibrobacter sp.]
MEKFAQLGLSAKTLSALQVKGFEEPTEIQALTIPLILKNEQDLVAQAQTGTGKTAAFSLPLLEILNPTNKHVQALILAPTRELVIQISEEINSLKGDSKLTVTPIYGGQSMELQLDRLRRGVSIVVGTPGRVIDHLTRKTLILDKVRFVVLDEGDEMLNMGFIEDIEQILQHTPEEKRVLLFSATMPNRIKDLASTYMKDINHVKAQNTLTTNLTDQIYFEVARHDKFEALCRIIDIETAFYSIIFCRTKVEVDELASKLIDRGYSAEGLHGDISQAQREQILRKFRKKQISLLVATDVAARGIDINNLTHVINYSLPQDPEAYVHRIGRTGRAGNQGTAVTFVTPDEFSKLGFIKRITNATIRKKEIPEVEQIVTARRNRLTEEIKQVLGDAGEQYRKWTQELLAESDPAEVVAALLKHAYGKMLNKDSYRKLTPVMRKKATSDRFSSNMESKTRLYIAKGKADGLSRKTLAEFIVDQTGVAKQSIEDIEVFDGYSFVTVPFDKAERIITKLKSLKIGKNRLFVEKAKPAPQKRRK